MWGIRGRVVPLAADTAPVRAGSSGAFVGTVWIDGDGTVAAVTRGRRARPAGAHDAQVVDVGSSLVVPGLVDLHNHLAYDTLPLWTEPAQKVPFAHHDSWPRAATYAASTTWPAYAFITAAPQELLAYVETKALVGGTTTIQGSPPMNRPRDGWLVRNVDDESFGTGNRDMVYASVLTATPAALATRANAMRSGSLFVYHCGEGQRGSLVAREYADATAAGCLQSRFVAVHANAVDPVRYADWSHDPGAVAWSPFSNLWLYGQTTDVPALRAAGVTVCLGADWAPSGTKHVLGELKVARIVADHLGWHLTDEDLVRMVTANPGDVLARAWGRQVGRLQAGAVADVVVLHASSSRVDPFRTILRAVEDDVQLVVVDGVPRYATPALADETAMPTPTPVTVGSRAMRVSLTRPDDGTTPLSWDAVVARLEAVRADPRGAITAAQASGAQASGAVSGTASSEPGAEPFLLALDMPTGEGPVGGLPHDLGQVVVPPLQSLVHDADWLASVHGRGFHDGVLDGLGVYYD
ncbi:amidohydrolase family protein [Luteimicrobium subarcticum]|uniref:Cytosine/adenosine deaminase-related metal-dependent hydrolase n=1 Tax=Luteimicrobium subarcticum TaxID=620910 RepID=A0A2M8WJ83_9MICO|nr:amidohydrolase family protein [Luteimicrobium subarcticum]PJI90958.1 cytosine/adenosine deaminase-related metal-dependent hydrolase [Luteimicrobium subarcticum]